MSDPTMVPPEADASVRSVLRTPWVRRWALVALSLMLAWTAVAWRLNERQYARREAGAVDAALAQATTSETLVEDSLHQGLAQLDGVARMLTRLPSIRQAMIAAGPGAPRTREPVPELRSMLQAQPDLAAIDDFLASSSPELGADLIYLLDDAGNCIASSDAGTAHSVLGSHLPDPAFFQKTRVEHGARRFAVGPVTGVPGVYASAAVYDEGRFVGAVVAKRNTRSLAAMVGHEGAFVVDAQGVVILAQDPQLLQQTIAGAPVWRQTPRERATRYGAGRLQELRIQVVRDAGPGALYLVGADPVPQVLARRHMADDDLDVYVAQHVPEAEALARDRGVAFALLVLAGVGAIALAAAGLGGWRARLSVIEGARRIAQAHRALKASEERFRATFESAGDAIVIMRRGTLVDCNRRAAELLGAATRDDLLGQDTARFVPEIQPDGQASAAQEAFHLADVKQGAMKTIEWRCLRLDGAPFDAEVTLSLLRYDGHNLLQAVLRDVSERRRMIAALAAAKEEAERANRGKSVFLANMSHEIRTPLNAVLGFTQLLMADRTLPEATLARLRVIHGAGNRLLGLINDVLDLAKIESGGLQVQRAPFDLLHELRDIASLYEAHARAKGLALQSDLALAAPAVVEGDRTKVGQIVANLLGNALKFTERGHVGLHVWRDADRTERVWFEVGDTGPGIAPQDLAELFVPFRQGATGQEKGGTGLGLALSRDMARAMGGELTMASTPGVGTQVRFWLPLPAGRLPSAGPAVGAGAQVLDESTPSCAVLVIEDDPFSRDVLVDLLRAAGCTVMQAFDGVEGLARCREERFDIVFSDIRMPRMDGIEMIARLRADPATRALPVVAVTASSLEHERRFYIDSGFQDFIGKPYPFHEVYRVLVAHAGVRLRPAAPAVPAREAEAGPAAPAAALAPGVREQLRALASAAASGQLAAVARQMAAIPPEAIGRASWQALDDAAHAYDFQLVEERVNALLARAGGAGD